MSTDAVRQVSGIEMTAEEIDELLYDRGHGVLALADGGVSHNLPMSFGYDGERAFMQFIEFGGESEKASFHDTTEQGSLTVYEVDSRFEWRSVIARGPLAAVPEEERQYAENTLDDNGWFPMISPPTDPISGISRVALEIETVTGRKGPAYQD